ncbi:MAG: hypothetical protein ACLFNY_02705 [Candidatus Aenigmatarchaeota archaeon]
MSTKCVKRESTSFAFASIDDSTDSDFIQEHIDSFFPPYASEEVIDEDLKESLNEDEFENRSANYHVLETPVTSGIPPEVIELIPWTGSESMDDTMEAGTELMLSCMG